MSEEEARQRCERLQAEHPDRETHQWVPIPAEDGEWAVAKISLPRNTHVCDFVGPIDPQKSQTKTFLGPTTAARSRGRMRHAGHATSAILIISPARI